MGIIRRIRNAWSGNSVGLNDPRLLEWLGIDDNTPRNKLSEATYFACLKILAESVGKMPLKLHQETEKGVIKSDKGKEYSFLRFRPNDYMGATLFWSTVEMNRNHHGNAYVWCRYSGTKIKDLWIMPSEDVSVVIDNAGIFGTAGNLYYKYADRHTGEVYTISGDYVMHFKTSMTFDGIIGMPVREILKHTIEGSLESQRYMNNLYKNGMTGRAVLEYTGDLDDKHSRRLVKGFEEFSNGAKNAGRIIPVPIGMRLMPLDIKLTDSQFFELKKYSASQIAAAFGVKPNHLNDYEKSSYATSEVQNLTFYIDTLLYILKQYEDEITYKCMSRRLVDEGYFWKFNVNVILRADIKSQIEAFSQAVNNMLYRPNEARYELDLPADEHGDQLYGNGNYIPIHMLGMQYNKKMNGGDESE